MNESAIENALGQRLATLTPARPIVWPNKDAPAGIAKPYMIFDPVRVGRTDATIAGGAAIARGYVVVTVVAPVDAFSGPALTVADGIAALFPYGLRISSAAGRITIIKPPEILRAFRDGPDWRQPVRIDYEAS
jgi:hypothetical protein